MAKDTEHHATDVAGIVGAVITVSDTRTPDTDVSGDRIAALMTRAGHTVAGRQIVPDEPGRLLEVIDHWYGDAACRLLILTGGTGVSARDRTCQAVASRMDRRLEAFGPLFAQLSFEQVGPAAMLSNAMAGVRGRQAIFALPGSPAAVELAMTRLILPVAGHLLGQLDPKAPL